MGSQLVLSHWRPSDGPSDILCSAKSQAASVACSGPEEPPCAPPLSATGPSPRALRLAGSGPLGLAFKFFWGAGAGFPTGFAGAIAIMMPSMPAPQCPAGQCWLATRRRVRVASEMARDLRLVQAGRFNARKADCYTSRFTVPPRWRIRSLAMVASGHSVATCLQELEAAPVDSFVSVPAPAPAPATALGDDAPRSSDD